MKKLITITGVVLLACAIALPAFARGPGGMGKGMSGQGYSQGDPLNYPRGGAVNPKLTDEQKTQLQKLHQKFIDDTATTRSQMIAKRGELQTLMGTSNPDASKLKAIQKELSDLQAKMAQDRITMQLEVRKIDPDARFGMGFGPQGKGGGPGKGGRMPMRGQGQGPCWN